MSEYRDWKITLAFAVRAGDTEGVMTERCSTPPWSMRRRRPPE